MSFIISDSYRRHLKFLPCTTTISPSSSSFQCPVPDNKLCIELSYIWTVKTWSHLQRIWPHTDETKSVKEHKNCLRFYIIGYKQKFEPGVYTLVCVLHAFTNLCNRDDRRCRSCAACSPCDTMCMT